MLAVLIQIIKWLKFFKCYWGLSNDNGTVEIGKTSFSIFSVELDLRICIKVNEKKQIEGGVKYGNLKGQ